MLQKMQVIVNMESAFNLPEEGHSLPHYILKYQPNWHCKWNDNAQHRWTYYTIFEIDELDLEPLCDAFYHIAREHQQDAIAVKVVAHPELSRTVGPRADKWTYDDSKIIIG